MPSLSSSTLSLAILAAGYLHARCITNPNQPLAPNLHSTDRIRFLTTTPAQLGTHVSNAVTIYQALVTLFSTSSPSDRDILAKLLPNAAHLNPDTVHWTPSTIANLTLVLIGAAIRLSAYGGLGRNFTFQLSQPDRLVTSGVYRYLQHPSYTGMVLLFAGYGGLVVNRVDTPFACLLPEKVMSLLRGWEGGLLGLGGVILFVVLGVRIRDEERMLKEKFGKEWEVWHKRTARLIPGVF